MVYIIETKRLWIRGLDEWDSEALTGLGKDETPGDIFQGWESCKGKLEKWLNEVSGLYLTDSPQKAFLPYGIVEKSSGKLVGAVGCRAFEGTGRARITYLIGSGFRGNGYAAEAVAAYTDYFFSKYPGIREVTAAINPENLPSIRTAERAGYRFARKALYRDINDKRPREYCFYRAERRV